MSTMLSEKEVATRLGVSVDDINKLVNQQILRPQKQEGGHLYFTENEIAQIRPNKEPTLSEQAAQVGIQIQREVVTSVSTLRKVMQRLLVVFAAVGVSLIWTTVVIAALFRFFPQGTSDFFGYYYRFNAPNESQSSYRGLTGVLAVNTTNPDNTPIETSVVADLLKPIAATSLVAIKSVDEAQYKLIVTKPANVPVGIPGPAGKDGAAGVNGQNGPPGPAGIDGADGMGGAAAGQTIIITSDTAGTDGTSTETDTLASVTARGAATDSLITLNNGLTITAGVLTLQPSSVAISALAAGDYSTKITSGTYSINILGSATDFTGELYGDVTGLQGSTKVEKINGASLGVTTASSGNLLVGNGSSWESRAMSGDATINYSGGLTLKNVGTPGVYGGPATIPVFTTDAQGRVSSVANTTIAGLTTSNLAVDANIANEQLANSSILVSGNSGSGAVLLGGGLIFSGLGITNITASGTTLQVNTIEADTLSSVTSRGGVTSSPVTINGNFTSGGTTTLSALPNCGSLATDASGVVRCGGLTGTTATYTDINPATIADNNTTEIFDDLSKPNITPDSSSQTVMVTVHARFTGTGANDTDAAVRIVRSIGSAASCSTSPQVGDTFSAFMTNTTDIQDATATFLDSPSTTSQVYYTVCSSSNSSLGDVPTSNRIDVSLVKLGADLAENYYTNDKSIAPGDVVTIDGSLPAGVKKSDKPYDDQLLGVVSTEPGSVLDDGIGLSFGRAVPIALAGRVPVRVSVENGAIKPGDSLTSSSTPGVAMKATKSGTVVGISLGSFEGDGIGRVLIFVENDRERSNVEADQIVGLHGMISNILKNVTEFVGNVTFKSDVAFLGRPTFNKDTAGLVQIGAGATETTITFDNEYPNLPAVIASISLVGDAKLDQTPNFAVYDISTKGFKIKLSKPAATDINFSWVALAHSSSN